MKLKLLRLRNFKGFRAYELRPGPGVTNIKGDNATGKSTLFDAWLWLLFGKDSQGRADFDIKTIDSAGKVLPNLEHEVEAIIEVDGHDVSLCRTLIEKRGQRGPQRGKLIANETKYTVNGAPKREIDYKAAVAAILPEERFRMLTDPRYVAEAMPWRERRALVLSLSGDISDADVIAADDALKLLGEYLAKHRMSLDDYREMQKASRTKLTKEIDECKPRLDELQRGLPTADVTKKRDDIEGELHVLRTRRQGTLDELNSVRTGGGVQDKANQLRAVMADMQAEQDMAARALRKEIGDHETDLRVKLSAINGLTDDLKRYERRLSDAVTENAVLERRRETLMAEWREVNRPAEAEVTFKPDSNCPTCGQPLPAEQIQAAIDKALAALKQKKSQRLREIDTEGQDNKAKRVKLVEDITTLKGNIDKVSERIAFLRGEADALRETINGLKRLEGDIDRSEPTAKYSALARQEQQLLGEIAQMRAGTAGEETRLLDALGALDTSIADAERQLAQLDERDKRLKRIDDLKGRQKALAGEYETVEKMLALTDLFVTTKVRLLEKKVNGCFAWARFKMFRELVNGGVEECCEVMYDGIPYGVLNHGARLNVGLDIINTLQAHWSTVAPVWIDNAEAVTDISPTDGQQIRLYVSEADDTLRVEAC